MKRLQLLALLAAAVCCTSCLTRIVTVADTTTPVRYTQASPVYVSPYTTTTVRVPARRVSTTTTVKVSPVTSDISLYLDLQAVAAAYAQSNTVEEFETILNSYEYMISNLDLNGDGYVDYLRVMETRNGYNHLYVIQAVLAQNIYQDVATLVVEGMNSMYANPYVQVIGNPYIYGNNYIIEPVFVRRPPLFDRYRRYYYNYTCWSSPYYYTHFPPYYHYCAPRHYSHYHSYVNTYMSNHKYCHQVNYTEVHHYVHYVNDTKPVSKNDYAVAHPEGSFNSRNTGVTYTPSGSSSSQVVSNTRQLQQSINQSGAATVSTNSRGTAATSTSGSRGTTTTTTSGSSTNSRGTSSSTSSTVSRGTTTTTTSGSTASRPAASTTTTTTSGSRTSSSTTSTTTSRPATTTTSGSTSSRTATTSSATSSPVNRSTTTTTSRVSTSGQARTSTATSGTSNSRSSSTTSTSSSRQASSSTSTSSRTSTSTTSGSTSSRSAGTTSTTTRGTR
ncbi:MAG: hypothetical protein KBS77_03045 [Bacteroidales bacterium]|nr:hypothetical protein [Candidatus Colicola faecequi]